MLNNEMTELAKLTSYISPINYISGSIVEYDISSANITMLKKYNKIDDDFYNYIKLLPKIEREIAIGKIIKNDMSFYDTIHFGITEAKKQFFDINNIKLESVVRIANDAVYLLNTNSIITNFDDVIFKEKSKSSVMMHLDNLIIFFWCDENGINLDVKGLSDYAMNLHSDYLLSVIANTIYIIERVSVEEALKYVNSFYEDYINLNLPKEYYRELTSQSLYHVKDSGFYISDIINIHDIDINYNLLILRKLWGLVLEKYNLIVQKRRI